MPKSRRSTGRNAGGPAAAGASALGMPEWTKDATAREQRAAEKADRVDKAVRALDHEKMLKSLRRDFARRDRAWARGRRAEPQELASILGEMTAAKAAHREETLQRARQWEAEQLAALRRLSAAGPLAVKQGERWAGGTALDPSLRRALWRTASHEPGAEAGAEPEAQAGAGARAGARRAPRPVLPPWKPAAAGKDFGGPRMGGSFGRTLVPRLERRVGEIRAELEGIPPEEAGRRGLRARIGADLAEMAACLDEARALVAAPDRRGRAAGAAP